MSLLFKHDFIYLHLAYSAKIRVLLILVSFIVDEGAVSVVLCPLYEVLREKVSRNFQTRSF